MSMLEETQQIVEKVIVAIHLLRNDGYGGPGPFVVICPMRLWAAMEVEYNPSVWPGKTVRDRLLEVNGVRSIIYAQVDSLLVGVESVG